MMSVMCENLGIFFIIQAAVFKTFCNQNKVESGIPYNRELQ